MNMRRDHVQVELGPRATIKDDLIHQLVAFVVLRQVSGVSQDRLRNLVWPIFFPSSGEFLIYGSCAPTGSLITYWYAAAEPYL